MIRPVKGSELERQIEQARQRIERWPEWLKDAAGVNGKEIPESPFQKSSDSKPSFSSGDFID